MVGGVPQGTDRSVEIERIAAMQPVADESRHRSERDFALANDELWLSVRTDRNAVAHVSRTSVLIEPGMHLAIDQQHRARLGGKCNFWRGLEAVGWKDFRLTVSSHEEDAVWKQMEIAAARAAVDRMKLAPVLDHQADRRALLVEHAAIHGKGDQVCP